MPNTKIKFQQVHAALGKNPVAHKLLRELEELFLRTGGLMVEAKDRLRVNTTWIELFGDAIDGEKPMPKSDGIDLIIRHNRATIQKIEKELK